MTDDSRLRVAVLVESAWVSRYLASLLDWLRTTDGIACVGVFRPQRGYPPKPAPDDADAPLWEASRAAWARRPRGWTGRPSARSFFALDRWCSDLPAAADPLRGVTRIAPQPVPMDGIDCDLLIRAGADDASAWIAARRARYGAIGLDFPIDVDPARCAAGLDEVVRREHETGCVLYRIVGPGPRVGDAGPPGLGRQSRVSPWPANVIRHGWYPTCGSAAGNRARLYGHALRMLEDAVLRCAAVRAAAGMSAAGAVASASPWPPDPQAVHDAGRPVAPVVKPRRLGAPGLGRQLVFLYRRFRHRLSSARAGQRRGATGFAVLADGHPVTMSLAGAVPLALGRRPLRDEACLVAPAVPGERATLLLRERPSARAAASIVALQLDIGPAGGVGVAGEAGAVRAACAAGEAVPTATVHELGPVLPAAGSGWSSPFVFDWQGERYLCAASADRSGIIVHRALEWPTRWAPAAVLMADVAAAGPVLFEHGGRWWLLTNLDRSGRGELPGTGDRSSELHAFHADHPLATEWTPHPMNPLRIDGRGARNAGFSAAGDGLYRCGQMQRFRGEGGGIALYRIATLTPDSYREVLVRVIEPEHLVTLSGLTGVHGLSRAGAWAVMALSHRGTLRRSPARVRAPARRTRITLDPVG